MNKEESTEIHTQDDKDEREELSMGQMERSTSLYRSAQSNTVIISQEEASCLPPDWPSEVPLARVTTCGIVSIALLHAVHQNRDGHLELVYGPPDATLLAEKGSSTALLVLSLLASQPGCSATKDWLSETLHHLYETQEEDDDLQERNGMKRVDNVVSRLRHLLCSPLLDELPNAHQLRRQLVSYHRATSESGPSYRLAGLPLIWLDVEAIAEHIKQARALEQFGHDGFTQWQAAYTLAMQGPFLGQEPYSDWASWRRQEVETQVWDCVQALWRHYMEMGERGETEAIRILRTYWQGHVTSEDALRPLIELLGKHEWYGQAETYYAQLCTTLTQEGKQPDLRTQETMTFLRALQIQRKQSRYQSLSIVSESEKENAQNMNPLRRATTIGILSLLGGKVLSPEWWERLAHPHPSAMNAEAFTYFQQLLEIGWGLSNAGELHAAEHVVMSFLPRIFQLAPHQKEAASIAAEGLRLRGILAAHQLRIADKLVFSLQAVEYARQASDPNILVAELTELAAAFEYAQQLENSFKTHQEALPFAEQASPLIRSRFYGRSAIAFARKGRIKEAHSYIDLAYDNLPEHPENEQNFLSSDHGFYKLARHKGLMYLSIGKLAEAEKAFESIGRSSDTAVPERSRLEIVNDKGRVAILSNNLTKYAEYLEEGIVGSISLKSQKRFDEALTIYQQEMPKAWQNERPIKQIVERFHI